MKASEELLNHIGERTVKYIQIDYNDWEHSEHIAGTLEQVLPQLNFHYDDGYGNQHIFGTIWYTDGTWSERGGYNGSEWWVYRKCPSLPEGALEKPKTPHIEKCDGCGNDVYVDSGLIVLQDSFDVIAHNSICKYVYGRKGWRQLGVYDG